jgi:hypothetical protein
VQARVATALQARDATTLQARSVIMLQLASRQCYGTITACVAGALRRCCSSRRCGTVATGVVATLRHCGAIAARSNDGKQRTMQRWPVPLVLATTAGRATLLYSDGRWPAPKFLFFFTRQFQRENEEQDREKRDRASKPVFRLCWLASSFLSTPFNGSSN